ncbi:hypothetical protein OB2597_21001 [Pseudooceanicola batsensis HTCC2597]|uniref:DUF2796 domain-containing protein n=1 Tax=Pseudooceanicola batsensis (strain ATCC BAA-863 / DSM 15984 / KCTC 12145 / HTCC2597) TaxID=252305 RepID=A3U1G0_PSEBH|nr:DUF2796 domain-containing protein [Pseudooceanicola batsensis]EAQ02143.1 hypothetical protein OB2597_21001 [Pseudooceanicola batsensis HTCC2597]
MKPIHLALAASTLAAPAFAQDSREMDAHVHGVSTAEIAVEHGKVEINLLSPGMDIVGFEYEATSAEDKDAVEAAIRTMLMPENIVTLPEAAGCRLTEVLAHLHSGDHDHDDADAHMDDVHEHEHEDHAEDDHDHDHEDHGDDHDHEDHAGDDHDHGDEAQHSELHVSYAFACEDEDALTTISFPFFDQFENAQEIEAQYVTETGAGQAEITRDAPELTLE